MKGIETENSNQFERDLGQNSKKEQELSIQYETEFQRLEKRFADCKNLQPIIYQDEVETNRLSGLATRERWANECYNTILKKSFSEEIDIIFFRGKSARGYGLLTSDMLEVGRLIYTQENNKNLASIKLPQIKFFDDYPSRDTEGFRNAFHITGKEKVIFFDESGSWVEGVSSLHQEGDNIRESVPGLKIETIVAPSTIVGYPESVLVASPLSPWKEGRLNLNLNTVLYNITDKDRGLFYKRADDITSGREEEAEQLHEIAKKLEKMPFKEWKNTISTLPADIQNVYIHPLKDLEMLAEYGLGNKLNNLQTLRQRARQELRSIAISFLEKSFKK